jgi:hypothetical protein
MSHWHLAWEDSLRYDRGHPPLTLKIFCAQESQPQLFLTHSGWGPQNLHSNKFPGGAGYHTVKTTGAGEVLKPAAC